MIDLEILKIIIMLCSINALEDSKGSWTELPKIEKYQKECRVWYIDCYKKATGITHNKLTTCIEKRNPI